MRNFFKKQNSAQNCLEFTAVFVLVLIIFIAIIEISLYWRVRFCTQNIANEIVANAQIVAQSTTNRTEVLTSVENILTARQGLLNVPNKGYKTANMGSDKVIISSVFLKDGTNALSAQVEFDSPDISSFSVQLTYHHSGIFLYQGGVDINSSEVHSVSRF